MSCAKMSSSCIAGAQQRLEMSPKMYASSRIMRDPFPCVWRDSYKKHALQVKYKKKPTWLSENMLIFFLTAAWEFTSTRISWEVETPSELPVWKMAGQSDYLQAPLSIGWRLPAGVFSPLAFWTTFVGGPPRRPGIRGRPRVGMETRGVHTWPGGL